MGANFVTLLVMAGLVWLDQGNVASHSIAPGDRIITSQVFMALLGATTVQVGSIAFIIAQYPVSQATIASRLDRRTPPACY